MLLRFEFTRMPHTSEMWNLSRGFEDLYYSALFASDPAYAGEGPWRSWALMGLDLGIREAPPAVAAADRIKTVLRSAGKIVEVTVSGGRGDLIERVAAIVAELCAATKDTKSLPVAERAAALSATGAVSSLLASVKGVLGSGSVLVRESAIVLAALERDVAAFSYPDLVRVAKDPS